MLKYTHVCKLHLCFGHCLWRFYIFVCAAFVRVINLLFNTIAYELLRYRSENDMQQSLPLPTSPQVAKKRCKISPPLIVQMFPDPLPPHNKTKKNCTKNIHFFASFSFHKYISIHQIHELNSLHTFTLKTQWQKALGQVKRANEQRPNSNTSNL